METMHPVVLHGCSAWDQELLPLEEFTSRLRRIQKTLQKRKLKGIIIYSDVKNYAKVCYFSNYIPKHSYAILLVPDSGEPRLLAKLAGTRDIPYVKTLTWISDIRAIKRLTDEINEFVYTLEEDKNGEKTKPLIGFYGKEIMPTSIYNEIQNGCKEVKLIDMDSDLDHMLRYKSQRELALMKENVKILRSSVDAMKEIHRREGSVVTASIEAERIARNLGAQDVRILYSLDFGKTLQPFERICEDRNNPMTVYIAIDYLGYWVDGWITLTNNINPIFKQTKRLLNYFNISMKSGTNIHSLIENALQFIQPYKLHPILLGGFGYNIGLSRKEYPLLHEAFGKEILEEGNIYSVHACLTDENDQHCHHSSIVYIGEKNNEILWSSID